MKRFKNILLICDRESQHDGLVARALTLAKTNEARITLVDVLDVEAGELSAVLAGFPDSRGEAFEQEVLDFHRARLADIAASLRGEGIMTRDVVLQGIPFVEIIRMVMRDGHDLVMKGAGGGRAGLPLLFTSTDMHLLRKCPCPVWIMKKESGRHFARVLAAVDPSSQEERGPELDKLILDLATSLSERDGSELHVVHAWRLLGEESLRHSAFLRTSEPEIERLLEEEEQRHRRQLDAALTPYKITDRQDHVHLLKGDARWLIPELARDTRAELIVMGTVGRTGISGFFIGNTAESILSQVDCSVLAVKPPGFQSPVRLQD